jgi:prepilin-type N-terminal cleavage/methylation domain-containing protein
MKRQGFTLIELMIVIAIIAIIAAIAIPGILAAIRAANERNASGSLRQFSSVEVTVKSSDSDMNGINDYWVRDVAGLYYIAPSGTTAQIRMIEMPVALADGNNRPLGANTTYPTPANPAHVSSPKSGYWFLAQSRYETAANDTTGTAYGGNTDVDRFSFIAAPNSYGSSGKLVFIVSEGGTMYKRDPGAGTGATGVFATSPSTGAATSGGALNSTSGNAYDTFPYNPGGSGGRCPGPWSKFD